MIFLKTNDERHAWTKTHRVASRRTIPEMGIALNEKYLAEAA